jgi:ribA/ribD-fused uncharacterized protein
MTIQRFSGPYRFLSNFYPVQIVGRDGWFFSSVEHAYQAEKTLDMEYFHKIRIANTARQAKALGKKVPLRPDWEEEKLRVMYGFLLQKFQFPYLRNQLLATDTQTLVEGNDWGDRYWGVDGVGLNHLGKLLMQIREEIRATEASRV